MKIIQHEVHFSSSLWNPTHVGADRLFIAAVQAHGVIGPAKAAGPCRRTSDLRSESAMGVQYTEAGGSL